MSNFLGISLEPRARVEDRQVLPKCGTGIFLPYFAIGIYRRMDKFDSIVIKIVLQDVFESLFFTIVSHRTSEAGVSRFKEPSTNV